jgi:hypothetical protein
MPEDVAHKKRTVSKLECFRNPPRHPANQAPKAPPARAERQQNRPKPPAQTLDIIISPCSYHRQRTTRNFRTTLHRVEKHSRISYEWFFKKSALRRKQQLCLKTYKWMCSTQRDATGRTQGPLSPSLGVGCLYSPVDLATHAL